MRESEPAVEAVAVSVSAEGVVRPYSSRHRRSQRDSDYYLQREPIPGCPSFYDMGQPQVFKSEIIDNYKGTKNLTSTSVAETNGTVPWLVFTVKSTRPAANAVRAVFLKLGMDSTAAAAGSKTGATASATVAASVTKAPAAAATTTAAAANTNGGSASPSRAPVANGSGASSSTAASRRQRRAPAESACHLAALKVESDNCVSLHTMAVPFSEVEACGGFKVDNGKLVPGTSDTRMAANGMYRTCQADFFPCCTARPLILTRSCYLDDRLHPLPDPGLPHLVRCHSLVAW